MATVVRVSHPTLAIADVSYIRQILAIIPQTLNMILGGDFNCGDIIWDYNDTASFGPSVEDHCLLQLAQESTRYDCTLDLGLTNTNNLVHSVEVSDSLPVSDYDGTLISMADPRPNLRLHSQDADI